MFAILITLSDLIQLFVRSGSRGLRVRSRSGRDSGSDIDGGEESGEEAKDVASSRGQARRGAEGPSEASKVADNSEEKAESPVEVGATCGGTAARGQTVDLSSRSVAGRGEEGEEEETQGVVRAAAALQGRDLQAEGLLLATWRESRKKEATERREKIDFGLGRFC